MGLYYSLGVVNACREHPLLAAIGLGIFPWTLRAVMAGPCGYATIAGRLEVRSLQVLVWHMSLQAVS